MKSELHSARRCTLVLCPASRTGTQPLDRRIACGQNRVRFEQVLIFAFDKNEIISLLERMCVWSVFTIKEGSHLELTA